MLLTLSGTPYLCCCRIPANCADCSESDSDCSIVTVRDVSGCGTELVDCLGTFVPLTIAPANLLFVFSRLSLTQFPDLCGAVFSRLSLTQFPDLCLGYTASAAFVQSEIFKIFFTVPISHFRSLSALRTIPIPLDSCSVGECTGVST
jgi:hypothetical protein